MLVSKFCSRTSITKVGHGRLVQVALLLVQVPLCNLLSSVCDFVTCDPIVQRVYFYCQEMVSFSTSYDAMEAPSCGKPYLTALLICFFI